MSKKQTRHTATKKKTSHATKERSKRHHHSSLLFNSLKVLFASFLAILLFGFLLFMFYAKSAPELKENQLVDGISTRFFDSKGKVIDEVGAEKRTLLKPSQLSDLLAKSVISVEDKRFYKHLGIDPIRIIGSALRNAKAGSITGGGSTLTQQLIKLSFFSTKKSDQTLKRKAQEAWLAMKLEREKSKEEILTLYVNKVYMGNGLYGMGTASKTYYGKDPKALTLPEAALLAGIPNAPSANDPYTHPENAKKRRDVVLFTMLNNKLISKAEYEQAVNTPVKTGLQPLKVVDNNRKFIDNYLTSAIKEVKDKTGKDAFKEGMDIYLNLDLNKQKYLYNTVNEEGVIPFPDDNMQVASTIMDPKTGAILAQIGGRKINDNVQFGMNRAIQSGQSGRDIGSTIKPLIDYGPAIEYLNYSTDRIIVDEPYQYPGTNFNVQNYDRRYLGAINMRYALVDSRNVPAVKTLMDVGVKKAGEFLENLGIHMENIQGGNAISGNLSSEQLAGAYGAFANEGTYAKPFYVNKIVFQDETEEKFTPQTHQAMKDSTAYIITDMLKDVIRVGTGQQAQIPNLFQAAKTGTSDYETKALDRVKGDKSGSPDITFVGYTKHYVMSVWTGYDDYFQAIAPQDQGLSQAVYKHVMTELSKDVDNTDWKQPDSVVRNGSSLYVKQKNKGYVPPAYTPPVPLTPTPSVAPSNQEKEEEQAEPEEPFSSTEPKESQSETEPSKEESEESKEESKEPDISEENETPPSTSVEPTPSTPEPPVSSTPPENEPTQSTPQEETNAPKENTTVKQETVTMTIKPERKEKRKIPLLYRKRTCA